MFSSKLSGAQSHLMAYAFAAPAKKIQLLSIYNEQGDTSFRLVFCLLSNIELVWFD